MNRWFAPGLLLVLGLALALRLPQLGLRPMHNDEGVNAITPTGTIRMSFMARPSNTPPPCPRG
jgi:hypothetical protein